LIINNLRVMKVAEALKSAGGLRLAKVFEEADPQMKAAEKLCGIYGVLTPLLLAINALVSYMLAGRGEDYWNSFADYAHAVGKPSENYLGLIELVKEFVKGSRHHRLARTAKLSRLSKLMRCNALAKFENPKSEFLDDPYSLLKVLAECLKCSEYTKTIVFAVKMYYYGVKACLGTDLVLPTKIKVPADRRLAYLAYTSGIIELGGELRRGEVVERLMKRSGLVRTAWGRVAELSNIPPAHLDAPLWMIGRYAEAGVSVKDVADRIAELLGNKLPISALELVIKELLYKLT